MNPTAFQFMSSQAGWMILEAMTLLTLVLTIFFFLRAFPGNQSKEKSYAAPDRLGQLAQASENICKTLSKNLEEKKELTQSLIDKLDSRIIHLRDQLAVTQIPPSAPAMQVAEAPAPPTKRVEERKPPATPLPLRKEMAVYEEEAWNERLDPCGSPLKKDVDSYGQAERLLDAGYDSPAVTERLQLPKGEVQLMKDLKRYTRKR